MTNERFENRMEFIIEQQAKFAADIQQLQESQRRLEQAQDRFQQAQERTDGMIRNLVDVGLGLTNHLQAVDERLNRLAESQQHTDQRLDILIDVVDKLVRRNGGGNPSA